LEVEMRTCLVFTLLVFALTGCGTSGDPEQSARDRDNSRQAWKITLDEDGATHEIPVERMDIYLTEDDSETEIFELHGDGVTLVGEVPLDARVDYAETFENLIGKPIEIRAQGGDPGDPKRSKITLDGIPASVSAGTFTVERLSGKLEGSEGDRTLHGRIELRLHGLDGERTLRGSFGVHAVTWG
jgi:hypothetical protein